MAVTRLSDFIRSDIDAVLAAWEQFAKSIPVPHPLDTAALRDHAQGILLAIADDLEHPQSAHEQLEKSLGRGASGAVATEAALHGAGRVSAGFSVSDELAEFRALRASVLRLWADSSARSADCASDDLARFNEAIDQALAESVTRYASDKERNWRLFDALMSSTSDLSFIFDTNGKFIYANLALAQLYNTMPEDIIGKDMFELNVTAAAELQEHLLEVLRSGASFRGEVPWAQVAGHAGTFECRLVAVRDKQGRVEAVTGVAHDITERKAAEEKIKRSANYDSLTGLPNRSLFRDRLLQELKRAGRSGLPLALIFIDLDGFKDVNDRLGHDAGDRLLQQAAQRIGACVRGVDTVARLGGDEFTVIFTDVSHIGHIDILAQKILDELARPFPLGLEAVRISGSVGITFYPQDAATPEDLVRNADQAMYVAKNAGRNRFSFFTVGMRDAAWARLRVIGELRRALPQRQLSVYYQPIVELAGRRIVKAEALLRWHHPHSGLMLPAEFIGLAEETGLIAEIGAWVLDEALARARDWSARLGQPFQISVNKSLAEFMGKAGAPGWDGYLAARGAGNVSVEIAEGVLLSDSPSVTGKLDCLQRAGVQLAIDKFGIGCSSLACLKKFEIDYLKIDQSFVRGVDGGADSRTIAETIIVMAHKLGLKVIAEGVETAEQRDWLLAAQCDYAQGYLFSEPLSAPEFERLLDL